MRGTDPPLHPPFVCWYRCSRICCVGPRFWTSYQCFLVVKWIINSYISVVKICFYCLLEWKFSISGYKYCGIALPTALCWVECRQQQGLFQWEASNVKFWLSGTWNTSLRSTWRRTTCGTGSAWSPPTRRRTSCATSRSARTRRARTLRSNSALASCRVQKTTTSIYKNTLTYWWIKILYPVGQSMVWFSGVFFETAQELFGLQFSFHCQESAVQFAPVNVPAGKKQPFGQYMCRTVKSIFNHIGTNSSRAACGWKYQLLWIYGKIIAKYLIQVYLYSF